MIMMNWISAMSEAVTWITAETLISEPSTTNALEGLSLMNKGLLTTAVGLLGVFLVLGLFFATIKSMQSFKAKDEEQ